MEESLGLSPAQMARKDYLSLCQRLSFWFGAFLSYVETISHWGLKKCSDSDSDSGSISSRVVSPLFVCFPAFLSC